MHPEHTKETTLHILSIEKSKNELEIEKIYD